VVELQLTRTVTITTTGALTVTVTADRSKYYVNRSFVFTVNWTPAPSMIPPGCKVSIAFGDGASDSRDGVGPPITFTHSYSSTGTKTVTASVTDNYTGATGSASTTVEVVSELTATFTADKTSGNVPLAVTFNFSMSGGVTPYTWTLDFGDGSGVLTNPSSPQSHTYTKVGTYTAKLTVTDALGASASLPVTVAAGVAPPVEWLPVAVVAAALGLGGYFVYRQLRP
jgi:PKD repeat protein